MRTSSLAGNRERLRAPLLAEIKTRRIRNFQAYLGGLSDEEFYGAIRDMIERTRGTPQEAEAMEWLERDRLAWIFDDNWREVVKSGHT